MLDINKTYEDAKAIFIMEGCLDTVTSPLLEKEIKDLTEETKELVFDMEGIMYVSSAGLRALLLAQKTMDHQDGSLKLVKVGEKIMEVFKMTGFQRVLDIEEYQND